MYYVYVGSLHEYMVHECLKMESENGPQPGSRKRPMSPRRCCGGDLARSRHSVGARECRRHASEARQRLPGDQ